MKIFGYTATMFLVSLIFFGSSCSSPEEKPAEESTAEVKKDSSAFVSIFNGKNLDGWKGDTVYWRVENGNLVGEITPATLLKTNSFIVWQGGEPGDFELKLEVKISKD